MKVFIVVKDETDYNGERTYPKVFTDKTEAEGYCEWEYEKAKDWIITMREVGEQLGDWIPRFYVEESTM